MWIGKILFAGSWGFRMIPLLSRNMCLVAQVTLSYSGVGEAYFAGVGLFAHPDAACRCDAGYYLDTSSAPVR